MLKALRNIIIVTILFVVLAIVLKNSDSTREFLTPKGVPPPPSGADN